jgi:hypothetical protein
MAKAKKKATTARKIPRQIKEETPKPEQHIIDLDPIDATSELAIQEKEVGLTIGRAMAIQVVDNESMLKANEALKNVKALGRTVEQKRKDLGRLFREGLTRLNGFFTPYVDRLGECETTIKGRISCYLAEERRKQQAIIDEENRKAAKETERLEKLAAKRIEEGKDDKAAEFAQRASQVMPTPVPTKEVKAPPGFIEQTRWHAEVDDVMDLARAVVAGQIPQEAIIANQVYLNKVSASLKNSVKWPGVRFVGKQTPGSRG